MIDRYLLLVVVILGLVEGLTEFLPISSSFHVMCIGNELGLDDDNRIKFFLNIVLQLGSVLSIIVVFRRECSVLIRKICFGNMICVNNFHLSYMHIILGVLPVLMLGLVFYEKIKSIFHLRYMFYSLIVGGVFLLVSELFSYKFYVSNRNVVSEVDKITYFQAFLVGCFQCLALFPGFSRSGATIAGGLLVGMNRSVSSIFSFFLAVPIMFSAVILSFYKNFHVFFWEDLLLLTVGFFISFIISFLTVKIFMRIIRSVSFVFFAIYRFILAFFVYFFDLV